MLVWHLSPRSEQVHSHGVVPPVAKIVVDTMQPPRSSSAAGLACQGHAHTVQHKVEHCSLRAGLAKLVCHHLMCCSPGEAGLTIVVVTGSCNCHGISIVMYFPMLALSCML